MHLLMLTKNWFLIFIDQTNEENHKPAGLVELHVFFSTVAYASEIE